MEAVDINNVVFETFRYLATQIPEMAAALLGIIFSLAKWRKYPRPALLSFLGFGLLLVVSILFIVSEILVVRDVFFDFQGNHEQLFIVLGVLGVARSFLFAGAYLLLIFAIYAARKPRAPLPPFLSEKRIQEVDR